MFDSVILEKSLLSESMADLEEEAGSLQRTLKDLFAGAAGGMAQVLLGELKILDRLPLICFFLSP